MEDGSELYVAVWVQTGPTMQCVEEWDVPASLGAQQTTLSIPALLRNAALRIETGLSDHPFAD